MGWMNNWNYANVVPTGAWRGATTIPRDLTLSKIDGEIYLASNPVLELMHLEKIVDERKGLNVVDSLDLSNDLKKDKGTKIEIQVDSPGDFSFELGDGIDQKLVLGYQEHTGYFIDRTKAGKSDFEAGFAKKHSSPRISECAC